MKRLIIQLLLLVCISFPAFHAFSAQDNLYDQCRKWVVDAIGVHCKSDSTNRDVGAQLFFSKLHNKNDNGKWCYESMNPEFPFSIILNGPGLEEGVSMTKYGEKACTKFCKFYSKNNDSDNNVHPPNECPSP